MQEDSVPPGLYRVSKKCHKTHDEDINFVAVDLAELLPSVAFVLAGRNRRKFKSICAALSFKMGAIHKMAATLGGYPTARALWGNFSSRRSLLHPAKHFFLVFSSCV